MKTKFSASLSAFLMKSTFIHFLLLLLLSGSHSRLSASSHMSFLSHQLSVTEKTKRQPHGDAKVKVKDNQKS